MLTRWTPERLRPYVDHALDAFGANRLMFGSDWPVCLLAASYADVVTATEAALDGLSSHERTRVYGGNAARVHGLPAAVG